MPQLADDFARGLFQRPQAPCLSLYQPTHRSHPDNAQDPIRFSNLVKQLEQSLLREYPKRDIEPLLKPFRRIGEDTEFWKHTLDGIALLVSPEMTRIYNLERPVPELAVVAESFHIKPLLRMLQSADEYQILAISRQEARMFQGNRDGLRELTLPEDFPATLDTVVDDNKKPQPIRTFGTARDASGGRQGTASKTDLEQSEVQVFFRTVDRAVLDHFSRGSRLPLVLLALPENQGDFRALSNNPYLLEAGIEASPTATDLDSLRRRAWEVVEPRYLARLAAFTDTFHAARPHGQADADLVLIARSAAAGRVATVLIEAGRQVPGHLDPETGEVELDDLADPRVDDLLDDIGELVLAHGGEVVIVPSERMPTTTGLAAIYRF